jgi:hypothetical protein
MDMKKISKNFQWIFTLLLVFGFSFSYAQELKADTIHLTTEKIIGNETVVWDTIIVLTADNKEAVNDYLSKKNKGIHVSTAHIGGAKMHAKTISSEGKKIRKHISANVEKGAHSKTIVYKIKTDGDLKGKSRIMTLKNQLHEIDEDGNIEITIESSDDQDVIWVSDSGDIHKEYKVWISDPHTADHKFVVVGSEGGKFNVKKLSDSLKSVMMEYVYEGDENDTKLHKYSFGILSDDGNTFSIDSLHENLEIIKELKFVSKDEPNVFVYKNGNMTKEFKIEMDDELIDVHEDMMIVSKSDSKKNRFYFGDKNMEKHELKLNMEVSDADLKNLGIKTKKEILNLENLWLFFNKENVLNLKFTLNSAGKSLIKVYDSNGKVIFNDRVKYFPGTYDKTINLKEMNKMPLYIYIEQGNASVIKKLNVK